MAAEQIGLPGQLDVTGQQHPSGRGGGPQHQRRVVDRRVGPTHGVRSRTQDVERQSRPAQPLPDTQLDHADPGRPRSFRHLLPSPRRLPRRPHRHRAHTPFRHHRRQPADVVGVQVAEHHQRDAPHTQPAQARQHRHRVRPRVDQHRPVALGGGQDDGVSLPHVTGHDRPAGHRPPRRDDAQRHDDHHRADRRRRDQHPHPTKPDEPVAEHQYPGQQGPTGPAAGPPDRRTGHGGRPPTDLDQPAHRRTGHLDHQPGRRLVHLCQHGGQHTEHGRRCHRRRGQQVRDHRDQAHLAGEPGDQRRGRQVRGHRHGQRLGQPHRDTPVLHAGGPPRREQHQRRRRHHRQPEPRFGGQFRVVEHQDHHRGRERRHRRPLPPQHQRQQRHRAHHGGPQHARFRPGQHHEPD